MTRYADVAVFPHQVPITQRLPSAYTYTVPDDWPTIEPGCFVLAPFGRQDDFDRLVSGVAMRVSEDTPEVKRLKPLEALLHSAPVVSPIRLELAQWLSDTYVEPLSNCVRLFAPPGQSIHSDVEYALNDRDVTLPNLTKTQSEVIALLRSRGPLRAGQINAAFSHRNWKKAIDQLIDQGWVTHRQVLPPPSTRARRSKSIELATHPIDWAAIDLGQSTVAPRRRSILEFLQQRHEPIEVDWLIAETGAKPSDLKFFEAHSLIAYRTQEVLRDPLADKTFIPIEPPALTNDQQAVWSQIKNSLSLPVAPRPFLLHGITGSGKTEIYLRAVAEVLKQGQQAIVLVPEIALTPQTIRRFAVRFSERLAVWHSELSLNERYDTWRRVQLGQVDIVIGARSALFLPFEKLGLIVLDEEHDQSYKQSESSQHDIPIRQPLYHAREAAIELARLANATVILGSATPSLEAWTRAQRGEYQLLTLSRRILSHAQQIQDQQQRYHIQATAYQPAEADEAKYTVLPPVDIVDLRAELKAGNTHIFSRRLQSALTDVLKRGEQAILFMNRRGSSTFVMCRDCGYVIVCPRCDSPLTYHEPIEPTPITPALICHTCNYREVQPKHCPACGSTRIRYFGTGTQKIESELIELFPSARALRWDRDTTTGKGSHEIILQHFSNHEADVLIGTQMIAKGLDLPLVTLVGVISADTSLHLPDFRASERTFQLLTQVAGRAGRGLLGGRAIIQTYTPDNYAIETAARHDYESFAKRELEFRQATAYPPYLRMARLLVWDKNPDRAKLQAEQVAGQLDGLLTTRGVARDSIIGPAPCFFGKVRDAYRWHIALRHIDPASIVRELHLSPAWRIDIDPVNML
jgi:primosomal protein N' (replication factor Y)